MHRVHLQKSPWFFLRLCCYCLKQWTLQLLLALDSMKYAAIPVHSCSFGYRQILPWGYSTPVSIRALHSPPGLCQWASLYLHPERGHSFCLFFFPESTDISHSEWEGQKTIHLIWELERIKIPCHTSQYLQDWLARQDSVTPGPQGVPDYSRLGTTYFSLDYYRQEYRYGEEQSLNSECEINLASDSSFHPSILHLPFHHHQEREEEAEAQRRKHY